MASWKADTILYYCHYLVCSALSASALNSSAPGVSLWLLPCRLAAWGTGNNSWPVLVLNSTHEIVKKLQKSYKNRIFIDLVH